MTTEKINKSNQENFFQLAKNISTMFIWSVKKNPLFFKKSASPVTSVDGEFRAYPKEDGKVLIETKNGNSIGTFSIEENISVLKFETILSDFYNNSQVSTKKDRDEIKALENHLEQKESKRIKNDEKEFHQDNGEHKSYWD